MGRDRQQHRSPDDGGERCEGQYEKDPWRPADERAGRSDPGAGAGSREPEQRPDGPPDRRAAPRNPPDPKDYQRSDEQLREDISERLMEARYIGCDVTVEVSGAKVVLGGTVPERRMRHAIEDLVEACPGVQDIENKIRVRR